MIAPDEAEPDRTPEEPALGARVGSLEQRLRKLERQIGQVRGQLAYALAIQEGLESVRLDLRRERETAAFRAAYDRRSPLVTVCVATYNRAALLTERSLPSIIGQTYRNLQIVVVGDCCTDDTGARIAALRDDRITFENLATRGPYPRPGVNRWRVAGTHPMNRAMALAEGDFVCHVDDDDEALPERVEECLARVLEERAELATHRFLKQTGTGLWRAIGATPPTLGQVGTGAIFYHRFFTRIGWDVQAYRLDEPGDWNRIRRILFLEPRQVFIRKPLYRIHNPGTQMRDPEPETEGEVYLD